MRPGPCSFIADLRSSFQVRVTLLSSPSCAWFCSFVSSLSYSRCSPHLQSDLTPSRSLSCTFLRCTAALCSVETNRASTHSTLCRLRLNSVYTYSERLIMAKGLFSVYSDVPSTSATTTAAPKRRGLSSSSGLTSSSSLAYNKENVNPFGLHAAAHGKPGLAVKAKSKSINKPSSASLPACASFTKATYNPPALKSIVASTASANQICTGTLRTRVLPSPIRPSTPSSPAFSSLSLGTPRSATDSGYARSVSPDSLAEDAADEEDCEIAEMERYELERETAGDRRARALTESPLAEVGHRHI